MNEQLCLFEDEPVKPKKKKLGFTNKTAILILVEDLIITLAILGITLYVIAASYLGTLPFLVTLIGLQQAKTTIVLTAIVNKSKAENVKDGIVYDTAMQALNDERDC